MTTDDSYGSLRPTESETRRAQPLDGVWSFVADPDDEGKRDRWYKRLPAAGRTQIGVPASWNEQLPELDSFLGPAWYERCFRPPQGFSDESQLCILRFGSVNYSCEVYINDFLAGTHEGGHLPFEVDATHYLNAGMANRLVVRVDGRLERTHVPPGGGWGAMAPGCFPSASFDFYPFCGIQRSVLLCVRPKVGLTGLAIETTLARAAADAPLSAKIMLRLKTNNDEAAEAAEAAEADAYPKLELELRASLWLPEANGEGAREDCSPALLAAEATATIGADGSATLELIVPPPKLRLWGPAPPFGSPTLYTLRVHALGRLAGGVRVVQDAYEQRVGIRTVEVVGSSLVRASGPVTRAREASPAASRERVVTRATPSSSVAGGPSGQSLAHPESQSSLGAAPPQPATLHAGSSLALAAPQRPRAQDARLRAPRGFSCVGTCRLRRRPSARPRVPAVGGSQLVSHRALPILRD